jgi:hypothetical protein
MNEHFADRAGFLAALSADDPERKRATVHALSCADCRIALAEGTRLVTILKAVGRPPAPTGESLARAAADIGAETADERRAFRKLSWVAAGSVLVAWLFQIMVGSGFVLGVRHVVISLAVLAVAVGSVTLLRGKNRLGVVMIIATSGLLAYTAGTSSGLEPGVGVRCMFRELWAAVIPWLAITAFARRVAFPLGRGDVTVVAAAGALAGHAGQHLACQVPHAAAHLFAFHFSAVALAVLLGAVSFRALQPIPQRR